MLHQGWQLLQPSCQQQKRHHSAVCAAAKQACALTAVEAPTAVQRRRRRRISTASDEQLTQHPWQQMSHLLAQQQAGSQQQGPGQQQQQQQQPYTMTVTPRDFDSLLTSMIMSATTWQDLQAVHQVHNHSFSPIHTAAALSKLAKLVNSCSPAAADRQQQQLGPVLLAQVQGFIHRELIPQLMSHGAELGPRGLANSVWALSKLEVLPESQAHALLLQRLAAAVPDMEPQHISSVLYALAHWQHQQAAAGVQAADADVIVRYQVTGTASSSTYLQPQVQQQQQQQQWQPTVQPIGSTAAAQRAPLANTEHLIASLMAAAATKLSAFGPQALSNTLYAAALLQHVPDDAWLVQYWDMSVDCMAVAEQQHLSNMVYAAAVLGLNPPGKWSDAWMIHSSRSLDQAVPQGFSNSIWAVAKLGWAAAALAPGSEVNSSSSSSSWLGKFCSVSISQLSTFTDQALSNCCWAIGSLAQQLKHQHQQRWQQQQAAGSHTSPLATLEALHQLLLGSSWHQQLLQQLQPRLLGFNPQQLSNSIWGLASSGLGVPGTWLDTFVRASGPKLPQFSPVELSGALVALARLGYKPGPSWLNLLELSVQRSFKTCDSQVISNVVWAMVQLQHQPSSGWLQALLMEVRSRSATLSPAAAGGGNSNSISNSYFFTSHGLSVLLLSLSRLATARSPAGDSSSSSQSLPATSSLVCLLTQHMLAEGSLACVLSDFTSRGLCYLAGAAALCDQQQVGQQLLRAVMLQLVHQQQQQQPRRRRPRLFGEVHEQQHQQPMQQQQQEQAAEAQSQQQLSVHSEAPIDSSSNALADVSMVLWAAARLEMQAPVDVLVPLLEQVLHAVPTLSRQYRAQNHRLNSNHNKVSSSQEGGSALPANTSSVEDSSVLSAAGPGLKRLGALMYALGFMGFDPVSAWFRSWFTATEPLLKGCSCWTLAMMLWGAVWLEEVPPSKWLREWTTAWRIQQQQQQQQDQQHQQQQQQRVDDILAHLAEYKRQGQHQQQQKQHKLQKQSQYADNVAAEVAAAAGRQGLRVAKKAAVAKEFNTWRDVQNLRRLCSTLVRQGPAS